MKSAGSNVATKSRGISEGLLLYSRRSNLRGLMRNDQIGGSSSRIGLATIHKTIRVERRSVAEITQVRFGR